VKSEDRLPPIVQLTGVEEGDKVERDDDEVRE
jgi:hypothetical protein